MTAGGRLRRTVELFAASAKWRRSAANSARAGPDAAPRRRPSGGQLSRLSLPGAAMQSFPDLAASDQGARAQQVGMMDEVRHAVIRLPLAVAS